MFKSFKSAVIATGLVLVAAEAAMAANEYHLMCVGPNNSGYGTMLASANPTEHQTVGYYACGTRIYFSQGVYDRLLDCWYKLKIDVRMYYHNDYNNRLCTLTG